MYALCQMVLSLGRSIKTYFWFKLTHIQCEKMTVTTADNCLFKVTIKTPDEWYSGIFITNFELMKFIHLELQLLTSQLFEVCL